MNKFSNRPESQGGKSSFNREEPFWKRLSKVIQRRNAAEIISIIVLLIVGLVGMFYQTGKTLTQQSRGGILVADFNSGASNALDGYHNYFQRSPSFVTLNRPRDTFKGDEGRNLEIRVTRNKDGFCGFWMHLFNFKLAEKKFFNARKHSYLSFWIYYDDIELDFLIRVADRELFEKDNSLVLGRLTDFIETDRIGFWHEIVVPLKPRDKDETLNLEEIASVIFEFDKIGDYTIFVDEFMMKKTDAVSKPKLAIEKANNHFEAQSRAMWLWDTEKILKNPVKWYELFDFCQRHLIDRIWLQVLTEDNAAGHDLYVPPSELQIPDNYKVALKYPDEFRAFINLANHHDIKIEALDGYPEYALESYHFIPLAIVDAILDFNDASAPQERFDGIHFDVEPYLILGWANVNQRRQISQDFLKLNLKCQKKINRRSKMAYGISIPFWLQHLDPITGEVISSATYRGEEKSVTYHFIDHLDNVAVMNYRNFAEGADGMIAHAQDFFDYSGKVNGAKVYMGVETFRYDPQVVWFALGFPREKFNNIIGKYRDGLSSISRISGYKTFLLDDGERVHVGLHTTQEAGAEAAHEGASVQRAIMAIAKHYGQLFDDISPSEFKRALEMIEKKVESDSEWSELKQASIINIEEGLEYPGFRVVHHMPDKVSFAGKSHREMMNEIALAEEEFVRFAPFKGMAIHYYETYKKMADLADLDPKK